MSEFHGQWSLQQAHARQLTGSDLETFGKHAAEGWSTGKFKSLNEAVIDTVKTAGLSPEQVKRVCEFANTTAYLDSFRKEGSSHRIVDFVGGPANYATVLQDLNDGGGGTVFDRGTNDYNTPPKNKTASTKEGEEILAAAFGTKPFEYPEVNPLGEVIALRDKTASAYENLMSEVQQLETNLYDQGEGLYYQVKQAALSGTSLGEVLRAWQPVVPDEIYVKLAFDAMVPRLIRDGVFRNADTVADSLQKTGSARRLVNEAHPLITGFTDYCQTLYKLAMTREASEEALQATSLLTEFLLAPTEKRAGLFEKAEGYVARQAAQEAASAGTQYAAKNPGLIRSLAGSATDVAADLSGPAREMGQGLGEVLLGEGASGAKAMGRLAETGVKYSPHMLASYGAYRALQAPPIARLLGNDQQAPMSSGQYGMYGY